ncbi:MAG TPA: hypothetical protein VEA99_13455 [Gemmatimonadaceae bacterium]|nr:hypothetical protein [Gemmatimonadaceae bacterium]
MPRIARWALGLAAASLPLALEAQQPPAADTTPRRRRPEVTRFYDSATPLAVTLHANLGRLRSDRDTAPAWRWGAITYANATGGRDSVPVRVRPRGIWRRNNCRFPPLRIDFARATSAGTLFEGLRRPKLVNYCFDDSRGDEYVLQEYQLYRAYALLTPRAYRARLLWVSYADSAGRVRTKRHAIVTEDADAMAARLGGSEFDGTGLTRAELDTATYALAAVFQYMIGNVDFSVGGLHNITLVQVPDALIFPVPYDFDYAGAVNTHYAVPAPTFRLPNVRTRLFRGPCLPAPTYERVFALLRERREAIYALYRDDVGKLLQPYTVKRTLSYFDEFYEILDDPKRAKRVILDACLNDV